MKSKSIKELNKSVTYTLKISFTKINKSQIIIQIFSDLKTYQIFNESNYPTD